MTYLLYVRLGKNHVNISSSGIKILVKLTLSAQLFLQTRQKPLAVTHVLFCETEYSPYVLTIPNGMQNCLLNTKHVATF